MSGALDLVEAVAPFAERDAAEIVLHVGRLEALGPRERLSLLADEAISPDEAALVLLVGNLGGPAVIAAIEAAQSLEASR